MDEVIDIGEGIRDLITEEKRIINDFEKEELKAEHIRQTINSECELLLKTEREKTQRMVDEFLEKVRKEADDEAEELVKKRMAEIKKLEAKIKKNKKQIVSASLRKIIGEVENVFSTQL